MRKAGMNMRHSRNTTPASRNEPRGSRYPLTQAALRQAYERSVALAHAKTLAGDRIEAERHFQQAEHYLRSLEKRAA